jgi:hypothetical protein
MEETGVPGEYLSNINIRHQLFVWIRVLIIAYRHVATCIRSAFSASDRTFQTMLSWGRSFRKPSLRWILHIMDQWLYSISDHCFDDLTNYRQNCYSSIVDGIVKRQNIPDHAFYSNSALNRSLSYICNISFLEVHLERVANSIWLAR